MMDTIFALSSAMGQAGVAVVRISGPAVRDVLKKVCGLDHPKPRYAHFVSVQDGQGGLIDQALALYFPAPHSFTGEDVAEIQCHGSRAVLEQIMDLLCQYARPAEPGEFTRRAVMNDKMDLTSAEGLIDLIHADTQAQAKWALRQMGGELQRLYDGWRSELVKVLAYIEAFIDFPEEEIPAEQLKVIHQKTVDLIDQIRHHLADNNRGRKLREGFQVAIIGAPNVGKSSLLNKLSKRDAAIVSATAGTTRDVVEVEMNLAGYPVILADTAGLRETTEEIEGEGIRRAVNRAMDADFVLAVGDVADYPNLDQMTQKTLKKCPPHLILWNKADLRPSVPDALSTQTGQGMDALVKTLTDEVVRQMGSSSEPMLTRERYKTSLSACLDALTRSIQAPELELQAEDLRIAATALGKITGRIDVSDLFDVIFSEFCIGK